MLMLEAALVGSAEPRSESGLLGLCRKRPEWFGYITSGKVPSPCSIQYLVLRLLF